MSFIKKINVNDGSGREFTENTVGELTFDAKPEVGSFNAVTSDAVARAVAGASGEVPQVTESDNGKVLKAVYDEGGPAVEWGEAQGGDVVVVTYDTTKVAEISAAIKDAIAAGKPVVMYDPTDKVVAPMASCTVIGDNVHAQFCITKGSPATAKTYTSYQLVGSAGVLFRNTGTIVPAVSLNTDAGKVLTAGSTPDAVSWQRVYPDIAGNAGKVLAVNSGATGTEWVAQQGGSSYTAGEGIKIENDTISVDHDGTLARIYETVYLPTEVDESAASTFTTGSVTGNKYFKIQVGDNPDLNFTLDINTAPFDYDDTDERNIPVFNAPNASGVAVIVAIPNQAGGTAVPLRWELSSIVQADTTRASTLYGFTHVIEAPDGQINTSLSLSDFIWGEQDPADYIDADGYLTLSIWWAESVERGRVTNLQSMDPGLALHYDDGVTENSWPVFSSSAHYEQETNKIKVASPVPFVVSSDSILGVDPSSNTPAWIEKKSVFPSINSGDAGKVLGVTSDDRGGSIGWVAAGGATSYVDITTGTAVLDRDNTVVTSTADITSVTVGANVKQAVVQWTVSSTTTLPTVVDAGFNLLKAASNNPSALTVGKTYQLSILNGCYVIAEFA